MVVLIIFAHRSNIRHAPRKIQREKHRNRYLVLVGYPKIAIHLVKPGIMRLAKDRSKEIKKEREES